MSEAIETQCILYYLFWKNNNLFDPYDWPFETINYFPKRHLYIGIYKLKKTIKNVIKDIHYYVSQSRVLWNSLIWDFRLHTWIPYNLLFEYESPPHITSFPSASKVLFPQVLYSHDTSYKRHQLLDSQQYQTRKYKNNIKIK